MPKQILINVDDELYTLANDVLDSAYLDMQSAITMYLKRICKEQSISFMYPNQANNNRPIHHSPIQHYENESKDFINAEKMTKIKAMRLLIERGGKISANNTFASKNKRAYHYWANPPVEILQEDWSLILNDWKNNKLFLFFIPARTIPQERLTVRSDKPQLIDLQIMYDDPTFTDNRSGVSFKPYFIKELDY